jgi:hypothetical protein
MIANDHELQVTFERLARFQAQVARLQPGVMSQGRISDRLL